MDSYRLVFEWECSLEIMSKVDICGEFCNLFMMGKYFPQRLTWKSGSRKVMVGFDLCVYLLQPQLFFQTPLKNKRL